ncbi:FtsX-like permease family protein [Lusitaniella coriacea LEGE 07157]|uniref:FtsX-like permease family protein n=1 Tax=Lusitaniella coriacea LEGE 07157 TaxID=945747 RepID=A0A8J7DVM2_9CYAN|nr:ABC transporter permease DevC [Lusitaniella coriacea]MBE9115906.1 FtsX-like permease family protein [Lusitaniella coriacea LEGE 07157]
MFRKIPLAWLQVTREKTRLIVAIAGIAFADILMFVQIGFQEGLYASANGPHYSIKGDLVLVDAKYKTIFYMQSFSRNHLYQALAVKGVKSVDSLYIGSADWINPINRSSRAILVFGIDPTKPTLKFPEVNQNLDSLKQIDKVIFDRGSRPEYGPIAEYFEQGQPFEAEINDVRVKVSGLFTLGASFSAEGNLVASDLTFFRIFDRNSNDIEVGIITLQPNADLESIREQINSQLPDNVKALTIEEFAQIERDYWANSTGIGFIFTIGTIMGFIVGAVIVYQILYSDVSDHLPEYATLKAMGYKDSYLLGVLIQESLILSLLGYLPSSAIAWGLYELTRSATLLPIFMTLNRAILVLFLTILMCSISGAIAVRKLREADPADIF